MAFFFVATFILGSAAGMYSFYNCPENMACNVPNDAMNVNLVLVSECLTLL